MSNSTIIRFNNTNRQFYTELKKRVAPVQPDTEKPTRGYSKLYAEQILGADEGCDFAFLRPVAT